MIPTIVSQVNGRVVDVGDGYVDLQLAGSLTLRVEISQTTVEYFRTRYWTRAFLHTTLRLEDQGAELRLYGFLKQSERDLFELLMSVKGVGPRLALVTLGTLSPAELAKAVQDNNTKVLSSVSGIGAQTAKRIASTLLGRVDTLL